MGLSPALAAYLFLAERGLGMAERQLNRRLSEGKEDPDRLAERKGQSDLVRPTGPLIWFHAASVGESLSILELARRLGDLREDVHFLLTSGTVTSARMIAARMPERAVHQYVPIDARLFVRRFLDHWQPDLAVWTESELWPALIHETNRRGVPMVLLNARMSVATFQSWRWFPGAARSLLRRFRHILVQDQTTARYLRRLGMPAARIEVTGTLKEGSAALPYEETERAQFAKHLAGRPVWLAASTHPGEEKMVAKAHRQAARATQRLLLIIAPRHPDRSPEIIRDLEKDGWKIAVRSRGEFPDAQTQIYLADTLGEMGLWYRLAPVSFLGGSLVDIGGHNPFEPAALGSAILHGPHIHKVRDIYDRLAAAGATREVRSAGDLARTITRVMSPDQAAAMAHAAWEVSSSGAEVTDRALELLQSFLPEVGPKDPATPAEAADASP